MRRFAWIFAAIIAALTFGSCSNNSQNHISTWNVVDPTFDSTVALLEEAYINPAQYGLRDSLTRSLDSIPTPPAQAQRFYWLARLSKAKENYSDALSITEKGLAAIDSARYPYEWARLISIKASLPDIPARESYELSTQNLRYFESIRDTLMQSSTLMRLGMVMWSINDTLPAAAYYRRADSLFTAHGPEAYRLRNLVNIANTLTGPGAISKRDSIMNSLLNSDLIKQDTLLYTTVLRNSYNNTGDFDLLKKATQYMHSFSGSPSTKAAVEADIAQCYLDNGFQNDSVMTHGLRAFEFYDRVSDHLTKAKISNVMAYLAYIQGDLDATVNFYNDFLSERLAMEDEKFSLETTKAEYRQGFEKARHEEQMRHARERYIWIAVASLAILAGAVIALVLYFRNQKARMSRKEMELQLEQNRNYLNACALAIDEKDRIIEAVAECVDRLRVKGEIGERQTQEITSALKKSLDSGLEVETFSELHKKIDPAFIAKLKADYPTLTDAQLRHAAYISMGLSPKQVAKAMNIEYESVKKSRARLRQRMGITGGASLEDALRIYNKKK